MPSAKPDLEELANRKTLAALQEKIRYFWSINSVDPTYQKAFLECLSKARTKLHIQFLAKEIESLEKQTSDIQQLYSSIEKREELIKTIKELNEFLWEQKLSQEVKEKARKLLEKLRLASVGVVECAANLREQLKIVHCISGGELEGKYDMLPIMHKGVNYLAKMNNDVTFLSTTRYVRLFNISSKSDPFLLAAATLHISSKETLRRKLFGNSQSTLMELPVSVSLLKRIKAADSILLKEKTLTQTSTLRGKKLFAPTELSLRPNAEKHFNNKPSLTARRLSSRKPSHKIIVSPSNTATPSKDFELRPLKVKDVDACRLTAWYGTKVSSSFARSYCSLESLLEKSRDGNNSLWLGYSADETAFNLIDKREDEFNLDGFAVICIDPSSQLRARVLILHASVLKDESKNLPKLLQKLTDYVWANVNCDEIRVELFHFMQDDKLGPYELLKSEYQRLRFKWKTLISDQEGSRVLILGINRPEGKIFDKVKGLDCKREPIEFKHGVVLTLTDEFVKEKSEPIELPKLYSLCSYLQAFKQQDCQLFIQNDTENPLMESMIESANELSRIVYLY